MKIKKILTIVPLLAFMMLFSSCGDYIGKEKEHPFFVKAGACKASGNYKEAAEYYEEFLNVCPRSPITHYELAALYGDNLDDPFKAVYHYQRYLELAKNSPDAENVSKFIEISKRKAFDLLSKQFESAETAKAYAEAAKVKKMLDQYVAYSTRLREQNTLLRNQNSEMRSRIEKFSRDSSEFRKTVQNLKKQMEQPESSGTSRQTAVLPVPLPGGDKPGRSSGPPPSSGDPWENAPVAAASATSTATEDGKAPAKSPGSSPASGKPAAVAAAGTAGTSAAGTAAAGKTAAPSAGKTHKVVKGDTLYNLAKKYYGSSRYYRLIWDANKAQLGEKGLLRIGQELVLPPRPGGKR